MFLWYLHSSKMLFGQAMDIIAYVCACAFVLVWKIGEKGWEGTRNERVMCCERSLWHSLSAWELPPHGGDCVRRQAWELAGERKEMMRCGRDGLKRERGGGGGGGESIAWKLLGVHMFRLECLERLQAFLVFIEHLQHWPLLCPYMVGELKKHGIKGAHFLSKG